MTFFVLLLCSCLLSLGITALVKQYLSNQLIDLPNERSSHTLPTPRGGGLGFIIAFAFTSIIYASLTNQFSLLIALWVVLIPLVIIGFLDDRYNLPAAVRYLVQLTSASIGVAYFGTVPLPGISNLGIFGTILAVIFSVVGITALINFYNFMDGLDGLVASVTALQLAFIGFYLHEPFLWLLVAALVGFVWWNWSPARIFMGDVGSTVLGATVAIALLNNHSNSLQAWSAFSVTFPLIADAVYTICRRLLQKENIFKAHRSHLYQRLQKSGFSHQRVALIYLGLTVLYAIIDELLGSKAIKINLLLSIIAIVLGEIYLQNKTPLQT